MTTLDLYTADVFANEKAPRQSFFDWIIKAHTSLQDRRTRRAVFKRRPYLLDIDLTRLRRGHDKARRAGVKGRE